MRVCSERAVPFEHTFHVADHLIHWYDFRDIYDTKKAEDS